MINFFAQAVYRVPFVLEQMFALYYKNTAKIRVFINYTFGVCDFGCMKDGFFELETQLITTYLPEYEAWKKLPPNATQKAIGECSKCSAICGACSLANSNCTKCANPAQYLSMATPPTNTTKMSLTCSATCPARTFTDFG